MKVHFIGALEGSKKDYEKIIRAIEKKGWEVLSTHSIERSLNEVEHETPEESELYVRKMQHWIKQADVVVVEATIQVLGTGYEIATALQLQKPVIVLYRPGVQNSPHVLKGIESDRLQIVMYNDDTLDESLKMALDLASDQADVRFNFFISPSIGNYLDWISKNKNIPRSVYLRTLIEKDMTSNKEYNA